MRWQLELTDDLNPFIESQPSVVSAPELDAPIPPTDGLIDLGYQLSTLPDEETSQAVPANKRNLIINGVPADAEYTIEVRAYRSVDRDVDASGLIKSAPGELPANPYRPAETVVLDGSVQVVGEKIGAVVGAVKAEDGTLLNIRDVKASVEAEVQRLSCCRFRGHRDKVFLEPEDGDATTEVQP